MHKCMVCSNSSINTRCNRPDVIYHSIPKNEHRRKKWLRVLGIDHCSDWHRVCSDHFLAQDYKPGGRKTLWPNAIPQSVDQNYEENGLSYNYSTQSNDVQSGNNTSLPMNEQMTNEEIDRNIIIVNINESPRRSSRKIKLTTTNEDMSYENMPRLQTERFERTIPTFGADGNIRDNSNYFNNKIVEVPMLTTTKDHTLGNGIRCSVKNCFNRHSKDLSFFGYPKDYTLRKKWIEKCGLVNVDPTKKVKANLKVCRVHFNEDCFVNLEKKNRLKTNAVPSLFLGNDTTIDERNIPSTSSLDNSVFIPVDEPSCSSTNYFANMDSYQTPLNVSISYTIRNLKDFRPGCCVPGCISNSYVENTRGISLFAASLENIDDWSSMLGIQLTLNSLVCERHFTSNDILCPTLLLNGQEEEVTSLTLNALPVANNSEQLATNAVPVLKTHESKFKRPIANKTDEHILPKKKIRNNVIDKSKATTKTFYISGDKNEYTSAINDTHQYISTCDLNPTLKSNTVKIKNPSSNTDNCSTSNTSESSFINILPKILSNSSLSLTIQSNDKNTSQTSTIEPKITVSKNVEPAFDLSLIKIEPSNNVTSDPLEINFEETFSPHEIHNSVPNNLDPTFIPTDQDWILASEKNLELSNVIQTFTDNCTSTETQSVKIEPEVNNDNLLSVTAVDDSSSSSMSNTLTPKLSHNYSSSVILTHELPSTSSSSVYNIPQKRVMQHEQGAATTTSNTVIHPEFGNNKILILKPISPINKPSKLHEIKNPVISACFSLAESPETYVSNSDFNTNLSEPFTIDNSNVENFKMKDDGFIYEISKTLRAPSRFWVSKHLKMQNFTSFFQKDGVDEIAKKIIFYNSFIPIIHVYGKKYKHNKPIKTKIELEKLIEKIDNIEKCSGIDGFAHENCIGYIENPSEDIEVCSACQELVKYQDLVKIKAIIDQKTGAIDALKKKIFERKARVSEARKKMKQNQKNENHKINLLSKLNLSPSGIINVMKPHH